MNKFFVSFIFLITVGFTGITFSQEIIKQPDREHCSIDKNWRFNLGSANNVKKDFSNGTSYFSYYAKTGYGDGAAAKDFEDRTWRSIDLPHDWAVELPFSGEASHSHGYKTIGWKYPETSVGWYRKTIFIPQSDLGRHLSIQFDGIQRNAIVWVNGFYLGQEHSGYASTEYDISDYLNYGGDNVIAVRVDASIEEGWFYEGAGIYRHAWLNKSNNLFVPGTGIFVTSQIASDHHQAAITVRAIVENRNNAVSSISIEQILKDATGKEITSTKTSTLSLQALSSQTYISQLKVETPKLWSPDEPYLYTLVTKIFSESKITDVSETKVGIRSITFDAEKGFFLNGKHLKIKGTNQHQDHPGVGCAIPDVLQEWRIQQLKTMGSNAIRTSHNPATPEFLDACDRLGMLVLDENRLMGINTEHLDLLKRMIERDRNHPSIIAWSIGNEEWAIESNITGERITATMQAYAQKLDSSRRFTVAISGGCGNGSSRAIDVMGFNYLTQCNIDDYHQKFPLQPSMGTEESTTSGTRGCYENDKGNGHMAATDRTGEGPSIETGWRFYDERAYLSGLFYWTGFDYKGEPNPLAWPAVGSQFGILDACGFPKDCYYYLKSWWTATPVLQLAPHWNWKGKEGKPISVWAYSNCEEIELFLNKKSIGRKTMPKNGHLAWNVSYEPGTLLAKGYRNGKEIIQNKVETTTDPASIELLPSKNTLKSDAEDVSVITVQVIDIKGRIAATAENEITFSLDGPGKIIGVGNGDPASHEPDKFVETVSQVAISQLKLKKVDPSNALSVINEKNDVSWTEPFKQQEKYHEKNKDSLQLNVIQGIFSLDSLTSQTEITLFPKVLCDEQSIYINGHLVIKFDNSTDKAPMYKLNRNDLHAGENTLIIVGKPLLKKSSWEILNTDPGCIKVLKPANTWKRKLFSGLAQIIVQSSATAGDIHLTAASKGLKPAVLTIVSQETQKNEAKKN